MSFQEATMKQGEMSTGGGGLGDDPTDADRRVVEPGVTPPPHVMPHSTKLFNTMHGNTGPAVPHDRKFDDREAGTETMKAVVAQLGRDGDEEALLVLRPFLRKRLQRHTLTREEMDALEDALHLVVSPLPYEAKRAQVHADVCGVMVDAVGEGTQCTYIDALKQHVPDWIGMKQYRRR